MSACCPVCRQTIFSMSGANEDGGQLYRLSRGADGKFRLPESPGPDKEEYVPENSNLCLKCAHKVPVELRKATPDEVGVQKYAYYYKDFMVDVCGLDIGTMTLIPVLGIEALKEREFFLDEETVTNHLEATLKVIARTF
jgi:hypothetical protein